MFGAITDWRPPSPQEIEVNK